MPLPPETQAALDRVVSTLKDRLRENLHSLVLYGSAARGNFVAGVSDLDLLIVLKESTPEAHAAIADALRGPLRIDPIVLPLRGLDRSIQAFALKFRSIKRTYRVLHGADPLAIDVDERVLRFLCEQGLRNLKMRLVHAYITRDPQGYVRYLREIAPALFTDLAEALRVQGTEIPPGFEERIPILEREFDLKAPVLKDLLDLHSRPRTVSADEVFDLHSRLHRLLAQVLQWVETKWPK
jgi:predicted nucleotidyltransferase